jgi:hypothetical protein
LYYECTLIGRFKYIRISLRVVPIKDETEKTNINKYNEKLIKYLHPIINSNGTFFYDSEIKKLEILSFQSNNISIK